MRVYASTKIEVTDGTNYYVLSEPKMLAADGTNIYLVNGNSLEIINKQNGQPKLYTYTAPNPEEIQHISLADETLFLFMETEVYWATTPVLAAWTKVSDLDLSGATAWHAAVTGAQTYIYFAVANEYFRVNCDDSDIQKLGEIASYYTINSIATDGNVVYFSAGLKDFPNSRLIYKNGVAMNYDKPFATTSLTFTDDKLIFISSYELHVMDKNDPESATPLPRYGNGQLSTHSSQDPIFVTALSNGDIYVIDNGIKKSIDQYAIKDGTLELEFAQTITAHSGSDGGFHFLPGSVTVIDEHRYVVADYTGIKLIDKSKKSNQTTVISTLKAKRTVYDNWQNIYLLDLNDGWHKYDLEAKEMTEKVPASQVPDESIIRTTALGDTIDPADHGLVAESWSLDRINGKIFFINSVLDRHAIKSFELPRPYWSPVGKTPYAWRNDQPLEIDQADSLYMETNRSVVLYKYPNSITPHTTRTGIGAKVQVLRGGFKCTCEEEDNCICHTLSNPHPVMLDGKEFKNCAYILYNGAAYYIDRSALAPTIFAQGELAKGDRVFKQYGNLTNSARVLVHNQPIFKFPMSTDSVLRMNRVNRNHGLKGDDYWPGLLIRREITVPDGLGQRFYEVRVDINGMPPSNGVINTDIHKYVGYINTRYVIDTYSPASKQKVSTNARVILPRELDGKLLILEMTDTGLQPYGDNECWNNKEKVRIVGEFDKKDKNGYASVMYYRDTYGQNHFEHVGFILVKYIQPDGIQWWIIVAIVALVVAASVGIYITVLYFRSSRKTPL